MRNIDKIKAMDIDEMAEFLKKVSCPQYDLLVGDWSCSMCNRVIQCEEEWEKDVPQYVEWLEDEFDIEEINK